MRYDRVFWLAKTDKARSCSLLIEVQYHSPKDKVIIDQGSRGFPREWAVALSSEFVAPRPSFGGTGGGWELSTDWDILQKVTDHPAGMFASVKTHQTGMVARSGR